MLYDIITTESTMVVVLRINRSASRVVCNICFFVLTRIYHCLCTVCIAYDKIYNIFASYQDDKLMNSIGWASSRLRF